MASSVSFCTTNHALSSYRKDSPRIGTEKIVKLVNSYLIFETLVRPSREELDINLKLGMFKHARYSYEVISNRKRLAVRRYL